MTNAEHPLRTAALILGFCFLFATMTTFVKLATNSGVPIAHIMFWRFAFGLIPVVFYLKRTHSVREQIMHKEWPSLATRAVMGIIAMWCTFQSFALLPVAEATTLHFTSTVLMTLLSIPVLGERVGPWRWTAIVGGFSGVLLILQPNMDGQVWGQIIALCAATIMAMNMLLVRTLQGRVTAQAITLHFHLVGALVMLPFLMSSWHMPDIFEWLYMAGAGLSAGAAQIMMNRAYLSAPVSFVSSFSYVQIVFVTLAGWLVFGNAPTSTFLIGAGIVVASGVLIAVREALLHKQNRIIEEAL